MRVATITFHNTANYGATLQSVALGACIRELGHDAMLVDYVPGYVAEKLSPARNLQVACRDRSIKSVAKGLASIAFIPSSLRRNKAFSRFLNDNVSLSSRFDSYESLCSTDYGIDAFVCGSDQIWNPSLTGGTFDPAFFAHFSDSRKIAYGASVGELDIESHAEELRNLLDGFYRISLREKDAAERLETILRRKVDVVLDPTLLHDASDYHPMELPVARVREPYLLLYNIQNSASSEEIAKAVSKNLGLRIVDLSPNPFARVKRSTKLLGMGPGEFLSLFHGASFVVTNSFHGTAFSVIYGKEFISVPHSTRPGRVFSLLSYLGLGNRIARHVEDIPEGKVDYASVNDRLLDLRQQSVSYLMEALGGQ